MFTIDTALVRAYLANAQTALQNFDVAHAEILIDCAQNFSRGHLFLTASLAPCR